MSRRDRCFFVIAGAGADHDPFVAGDSTRGGTARLIQVSKHMQCHFDTYNGNSGNVARLSLRLVCLLHIDSTSGIVSR